MQQLIFCWTPKHLVNIINPIAAFVQHYFVIQLSSNAGVYLKLINSVIPCKSVRVLSSINMLLLLVSTRSDTPGTIISDVRICDDQRYGTSTTSSTTGTTRMKASVPRASEDCDAVRTLFHLASLDSTKVQIVDV
jgi:hypothetical protein